MTNDNPFNIVGKKEAPPVYDQNLQEETDPALVNDKIKELINSSSIFIFMKGTPDFPQCGFSANTVQIFNQFDVEYKTFDVLSDMNIREGVKEFSNWPTIPQIYINQKFVGGNDIITDMYESGDLEKLLK